MAGMPCPLIVYIIIIHESMRHIIYIIYVGIAMMMLAVSSCSNAKPQDPNELAVRAAKVYYDYLIAGNFEAYVDGFYRPDSIPGSYREQLIVNAKQYIGQIKDDHSGLAAVQSVRAKTDTAHHVGRAFLMLCFADSTKEEIVVPMVLHEGNWYLK